MAQTHEFWSRVSDYEVSASSLVLEEIDLLNISIGLPTIEILPPSEL